ncbi:MAG: hypothetical protein ACLRSH_06635 [Turicibacter sp.]
MIKFSEISECAYVFCGDELLQKEDILDRLEEYRGGEFFTANEREVGFVTSDARDMLETLADYIYCNQELYEDWDDEFMRAVDKEDLERITEVVNGILERVPTCYAPGEVIEFDM